MLLQTWVHTKTIWFKKVWQFIKSDNRKICKILHHRYKSAVTTQVVPDKSLQLALKNVNIV